MKTPILDQMLFQRWRGLPISLPLLAGFIIALLIGNSGCSDSDRMDRDDKPEGPLVVRNSCLAPPPPSEAEILADRILRTESDELLFDPKERNELIEEIEQVLPLIREAYPKVAEIPVRPTHSFGRLFLTLEPGLYQTIAEILATEEEFVTLKTGNAEFDALTTRLELQGIALGSSKIFTDVYLCFKERLNTQAASDTYLRVAGVQLANIAYVWGDGPDIAAAKAEGRWFFIFRNAWGDCPSGCGYQEFFFFTVVGGEFQQITENIAATMLPFQKLFSTRPWW